MLTCLEKREFMIPMKLSEYHKYLEYNENPYAGYIELAEPAMNSDEEVDEDSAKLELMKLGYSIYKTAALRESENCFGSILKEAREYKDKRGVLPTLIYADEDIDNPRRNPFFKPDFSPDTLESFFYIGGMFLLLENNVTECYLMPEQYTQKARDILTAYQQGELRTLHVSKVLYHLDNICDYKYTDELISSALAEPQGMVSVVILSKDNVKMLLECIDSLQQYCDSPMEYIVVDNGSTDANRSVLDEELSKRRVRYIYEPMDFSYSAMCNMGAMAAAGEYLLFLNDDVLLLEDTKEFPSRLMRHAAKPWAGAVGVRLIYPPDRNDGKEIIQHIGIAKLQVGPSHKLATFMDDKEYERGRNRGVWNVLAVTGACLLVSKAKFDEAGGFNESIKVAYTDVDLCLSLFERGYLSICDNDVRLVHYESVSRGSDLKEKNRANRLKEERKTFYALHPYIDEGEDPFYNVNLTATGLDYIPGIILPWDNPKFYPELIKSRAEEGKRVSTKLLPSGKLLGSLDRVTFVPSSFEGTPDYYELEGWCIYKGKDQLSYRPVVALLMDGSLKLYPAVFKPRGDLASVFPDEKNTGLSGFICRIDAKEVDTLARIGIGVLTKKILADCFCYYMMTDKKF